MKINIIILVFLFVACKQTNKNVEHVADSSKSYKKKEDISSAEKVVGIIDYEQDEIPVTDGIPFGKKDLIEISFPSNWKLSSGKIYQKQFDSIYFHLQKFFDSYKSKTRYSNPAFHSLETKLKEYMQNDGQIIAKFPNYMKAEIFLYTGGDNNQTDIWGDLLIIKNGKVNRLNIYKYYEKGYHSKQKLFYLDEDYGIHIKEFSGDEEENLLLSYQRYTISETGDFLK